MKNYSFSSALSILFFFIFFQSSLFSQAQEYVYLKDSILLEGKLIRDTKNGIFKFREYGSADFSILKPEKVLSFGLLYKYEYQSRNVDFGDSLAYVFLEKLEEGLYTLYRNISKKQFFIETKQGKVYLLPEVKNSRKALLEKLLESRNVFQKSPTTSGYSESAAKRIIHFLNTKRRKHFPEPLLMATIGFTGSQISLSKIQREQFVFFRKTRDYFSVGVTGSISLDFPFGPKGNVSYVQDLGLQYDHLSYNNSNDIEILDFSANALFGNLESGLKTRFYFNSLALSIQTGFGISYKFMEENKINRTIVIANEPVNSDLEIDFYGDFAIYPSIKTGLEVSLKNNKWMMIGLVYRLKIFNKEKPESFVNSYSLEISYPLKN